MERNRPDPAAPGGRLRGRGWRPLAALAVAVLAAGIGGATAGDRLWTTLGYLLLATVGFWGQAWIARNPRRGRLWPLLAWLDVAAGAFVAARIGPTTAPLLLLLALPVLVWGLQRGVPGGLCTATGAAAAGTLLATLQTAGAEPGQAFVFSRDSALGTALFPAISLALLGGFSGLLGRRLRQVELARLRAQADLDTAQAALEQTRLDAESILAHLSRALLCFDAKGRLTQVNREALALFAPVGGISAGAALEDLRARPATRELADHLAARLEATREETREARLGDAPVEVTTTPVRDRGGEAHGLVVLLADLTARRAEEEERRRQERLAVVGELSAGLAHEIRNSLKPITGSVELLRRELPAGEAGRDTLMEIILRESESLENFLTEFLTFARDRKLQLEPVPVETLLGEELESLNATPGSAFRLVRPAASEPPLRVRADRSCLRQIVRNLGVNALEAGGAPIELGWRRDGAEAEIFVRDHGPGIPEEVRPRVFEPFFTTKPQGTGLGLAIAHDLADRLGGRLVLTPATGGGTRASIRLPLVGPADAGTTPAAEPSRRAA